MSKTYKIAIVGPESTGKSTLAAELAAYFQAPLVEEYAREYCTGLKSPCTLEDEIAMYHGQIEREEAALKESPDLLICDTTILNVKIWCDHVFEYCPEFIEEEVRRRPYDLYLLMNIDMPWQEDPLRDFPDLREHFLEVFQLELRLLQANVQLISGLGSERLKNALSSINYYYSR